MAALGVVSGPQDIPGSRVGTPPPLDHSTWSGSPETPSDALATPQTPTPLSLAPQVSGKSRVTHGFDSGASVDLTEPSQALPAQAEGRQLHPRRRSSTPFMFEIGEATSAQEGGPSGSSAVHPYTSPPSSPPSTGPIGTAVRRHLERSRTSFRRMRTADDSASSGSSTPRFKALRRLRAQSLSSSSSSNAATPSSSSAQLSSLGSQRSFDEPEFTSPRKATGKSVLQNAKDRIQRRRSSPVVHLSPPFGAVLTSAGLQGPSPPQPSDDIVWGTLSYRGAPLVEEVPKVDLFGTMLPRELKVAVFRTLLDMGVGEHGRWTGQNGARRELVRLSRVSKEWRSLCFDGTLWQSPDFTALANVLPAETMRVIIDHARPCIKTLCLEGLEALPGQAVSGILSPRLGLYDEFSSLTTLDLRGCHTILEADIIDLLRMSPYLKRLNLKGSRVVTGATLAAIHDNVLALEELDVSRCWNLQFMDLEHMLAWTSERQRNALQSLRVAGISNESGGHLLYRLASLPNLHRLDFLGCTWLSMSDIQDYIFGLGDSPSPLKHLILSGCIHLTFAAFELLVDRLPNMESFEAANLDPVFHIDPPPLLSRLVRSMPQLRRLDLDGTGRHGAVDDRLLLELIPGAAPDSQLTESKLEHLRIGNAKFVTASAMRRLIRQLPDLQVFIANVGNLLQR